MTLALVTLDQLLASGRAAFSIDEVYPLLGISRGLAYAGVRDGSIPSITIGRRILVPRARLLELLGEDPSQSESPASRAQGSRDTTSGDHDTA